MISYPKYFSSSMVRIRALKQGAKYNRQVGVVVGERGTDDGRYPVRLVEYGEDHPGLLARRINLKTVEAEEMPTVITIAEAAWIKKVRHLGPLILTVAGGFS